MEALHGFLRVLRRRFLKSVWYFLEFQGKNFTQTMVIMKNETWLRVAIFCSLSLVLDNNISEICQANKAENISRKIYHRVNKTFEFLKMFLWKSLAKWWKKFLVLV